MVPAARIGRSPRGVQGDGERHLLKRLLGEYDLLASLMGESEALVIEPLHLSSDEQEAFSRVVGWEEIDTELGGESEHSILGGAHPLPSQLDDDAVGERMVQDPPADSVPGLEDRDRQSLSN